MERQPLESLTGLVRIIGQAELPQPIGVRWGTAGLEVQVGDGAALNAWLAATEGDADGATESRVGGIVITSMPRRIDGLAFALSVVSLINEQAWMMSLASDLTYEECVSWLVEWPTLDPEQQMAAWAEIVDEHAMPARLIAALPTAAAS